MKLATHLPFGLAVSEHRTCLPQGQICGQTPVKRARNFWTRLPDLLLTKVKECVT